MGLAKDGARRYPVQDLKPYIGGQRYLVRRKELRTLNDVVDHYLLKKEQE
jgi:hypothetical protein